MKILDGKKLSNTLKEEIKNEVFERLIEKKKTTSLGCCYSW